MADQSYKNHARLDPKFHFTLVPLLWFILVSTIVRWWHLHSFARGLAVLSAIALFWIAFLARAYALKAQDRVIRLEERLRLAELHASTNGLSTRQLIALRFASDAETPALAQRAAEEQMNAKQIKEAVQHWRADHERI